MNRASYRPGPSYRAPFLYEILEQRWQEAAEAGHRALMFQRFLARYPNHNPAFNID